MEIFSSPGNIFLFGEHAVVYGRKCIITAIGMRTYCNIEPREDRKICVFSEGYGSFELRELREVGEYSNKMDAIKDLIVTYYKKFGIDKGVNITINSEIPKRSGGMSSSTAVLCSVLKGLSNTFTKIDEKKFYDFLIPFQRKIHGGSASGVEIFSSTFGGYNLVNIDPVKYENLGKFKLPILIVDTGIEAKTSETVPYVRRGWEQDRKSYEEVFDRIENIVLEGVKAIKNNDLVKLGSLMTENHNILAKELGVSHPKLNKIIDTAIKNGAYGGKLSGGGKGGIAIILTDKNLKFENCYKTDIGISA
ncbi:MAG: mevalonate kinase [Candidatus Aenigmarchaeota archaeon ex4484_56]|nr:MAG: mevalonate kinase [Candidatus Aenigmarchaeota archaeon ex4484_56]